MSLHHQQVLRWRTRSDRCTQLKLSQRHQEEHHNLIGGTPSSGPWLTMVESNNCDMEVTHREDQHLAAGTVLFNQKRSWP